MLNNDQGTLDCWYGNVLLPPLKESSRYEFKNAIIKAFKNRDGHEINPNNPAKRESFTYESFPFGLDNGCPGYHFVFACTNDMINDLHLDGNRAGSLTKKDEANRYCRNILIFSNEDEIETKEMLVENKISEEFPIIMFNFLIQSLDCCSRLCSRIFSPTELNNYISNDKPIFLGDLNEDGKVTFDDYLALIKYIKNRIPLAALPLAYTRQRPQEEGQVLHLSEEDAENVLKYIVGKDGENVGQQSLAASFLHKIYCYEDTEVLSSNSVQNILYNSKNFLSSSGWKVYIEQRADGGES